MASGATDPAAGRMSRPVVVAVILGVLLFAALGGLVFKHTSPTITPRSTVGMLARSTLPPRHASINVFSAEETTPAPLSVPQQPKPTERVMEELQHTVKLSVDSEQPVMSFIPREVVPNALQFEDEDLASGELYGIGGGGLHRIVEDTFNNSIVANRDLGPLMSLIRAHRYVDGIAVEAEVPAGTQIAFDPSGVLVIAFGTESGGLYCTRIRTPPNSIMLEDWERGTKWAEPTEVHSPKLAGYHAYHPVLFYDKFADAFRIIFSNHNGAGSNSNQFLYFTSSTDYGVTWSVPWQIGSIPGLRSFGQVIRPSDQDFILPVLREFSKNAKGDTTHLGVNALISDDAGVSFHEIVIDPHDTEESRIGPAMVELRDGTLVIYTAPKESPVLRMKLSTNGGKTWGPSLRTDIPCSGLVHFTAARLNSGQVAIVFHNTWHSLVKSPISIAISNDFLGKTFPYVRDLEIADKGKLGGTQRGHKDTNVNGFDFPTLFQTPDGLIHIAYSAKHYLPARKQSLKKPLHSFVKYVAVDEAWVQAGEKLPNDFNGVYQGLTAARLQGNGIAGGIGVK